MNRIIILVCVALSASIVPVLSRHLDNEKSTELSPRGMVDIGGHTYFISDSERYIWPDAQNACSTRGMRLLTLNSKTKNDEIMAYFRANGMGLTSYWTGGRKTSSGGFEWSVLNEPFSYTSWASGQPDDPAAESYVDFNAVDGWFDMPASLRIHFVCE